MLYNAERGNILCSPPLAEIRTNLPIELTHDLMLSQLATILQFDERRPPTASPYTKEAP